MNLPCGQSQILVNGPAGRIEGLLACPKTPHSVVAVVCHPHPQHGGTMHNKVVHTLAKFFVGIGIPAVRFNFRGVGASDGAFGDGIGEADDLLAVVDWVRSAEPGAELWLAGFSFGAGVVLRAAEAARATRLVLVAPSVTLHGFGELGTTTPTLVVQGDADEVIPPPAVQAWISHRAPAAQLRTLPGVGHFFHGALTQLSAVLAESLDHGSSAH